MPKTHPEGLSFEPTGHGFTSSVRAPFSAPHPLLTHRNIGSIRRNHGERWEDAFAELPPLERDRRTGRLTNGFSTDERERLASLAMLVDVHFFDGDRMVIEEERTCSCDQKEGSCVCQ
jgi:hypothetical protein